MFVFVHVFGPFCSYFIFIMNLQILSKQMCFSARAFISWALVLFLMVRKAVSWAFHHLISSRLSFKKGYGASFPPLFITMFYCISIGKWNTFVKVCVCQTAVRTLSMVWSVLRKVVSCVTAMLFSSPCWIKELLTVIWTKSKHFTYCVAEFSLDRHSMLS